MSKLTELQVKIEKLKDREEDLQATVADLEAERKQLPGELARCVRGAGMETISELQDRMAALPGLIFQAEIERLQTVVELANTQEAARIAERDQLVEVAQPLQEEIRKLREKLAPTLDRLRILQNNERRYRDVRNQARLKIDGLTQQRQIDLGTLGAPIVRALNFGR
ncbi:MAG: hypothetical protein R2867_01035 [Caldilineaceae bacterium]